MAVPKDEKLTVRGRIQQLIEPGTLGSLLLPTLTSGISVVMGVWALVTPFTVAVGLGAGSLFLAIITIRLYMNIDA